MADDLGLPPGTAGHLIVQAGTARCGGHRSLLGQLVVFAVIGLLGTGAYLALFLLLRPGLHAQGANAIARLVTAVPVGWLNARLTFRSDAGPMRIVAGGIASLAAGMLLSGLVLLSTHALISSASPSQDAAALVSATGIATVGRFLVLRGFATPRRTVPPSAMPCSPPQVAAGLP